MFKGQVQGCRDDVDQSRSERSERGRGKQDRDNVMQSSLDLANSLQIEYSGRMSETLRDVEDER